MGARTAERVMPPLTQTASEALWGRSFSSADPSTSGHSGQTTSSRLDDDDVVVLLSDEMAASEAAPLVSHNAVKLAFCGGVSGALAKTCTAPLARLTILYQVKGLAVAGAAGAGGQQLGVFAALRHIAATEGITALWKGNLITIMHRIPYSATNFFTYESTKRALQGRLHNESARAWAAGAVSGLVSCTAAYPLDLLRTRVIAETGPCGAGAGTAHGSPSSVLRQHLSEHQHHPKPYPHLQLQPYRSMSGALRRIASEQGVRGLYKGLSATLAQVVPGLAFNFCFYDTFKGLALRHQHSLAGLTSTSTSIPTPTSSLGRPAPWEQLQQQERQRAAGEGCPPTLAPAGHPHCPCSERQQEGRQETFKERTWQTQETQQQAGLGGSCGSGAGGRGAASSCDERGTPAASPSPLTSALCACLSGLCTSLLTFPLDVVRRRLQVYERGALGRLRYLDVVRAVYSEGGLAAFYRGLGPEFLKVLPGMAIAFTTYETLKGLTGAA